MATINYCDFINGNDTTGDGTYGNPYQKIDKASTGLTGGDEVRCAASPADVALTGTVTFTPSSANVPGVGTAYTTELAIGDFIKGADDMWYEVITITDDTHLALKAAYDGPSTAAGATTYKLGITSTGSAAAAGTNVQVIQNPGINTQQLVISGGWDLATQTQTGWTNFRQMNATFAARYGTGLNFNGKSYITVKKIRLLRYNLAFQMNNTGGVWLEDTFGSTGNGAAYRMQSGKNGTFIRAHQVQSANGYDIDTGTGGHLFVDCTSSGGNNPWQFYNGEGPSTFFNCVARRSTAYGFKFDLSSGNRLYSCLTANNNSGGVFNNGKNYFINPSIAETTKAYVSSESRGNVMYESNETTTDNDVIRGAYYTITKQSSVTQPGSGFAWKCLTSGGYNNVRVPIELSIARFAVAANAQVTFTAYMKKDHATNVGCRIICHAYQIAGVTADQIATKANDTNWEQLTLTFTPTAAGVVEVFAEFWYVGGNSAAYVDTISVSQA